MTVTTFEPSHSSKVISYPCAHSEFEVQAWLYMALRDFGIDVRGELKTLFAARCRNSRPQFCRFDLVIFEQGKAVTILEVKANFVRHKNGVDATRQASRYREFGIPVQFVYGMNGAEKIVRELAEPAKAGA
jgi:hypothetical protein